MNWLIKEPNNTFFSKVQDAFGKKPKIIKSPLFPKFGFLETYFIIGCNSADQLVKKYGWEV